MLAYLDVVVASSLSMKQTILPELKMSIAVFGLFSQVFVYRQEIFRYIPHFLQATFYKLFVVVKLFS